MIYCCSVISTILPPLSDCLIIRSGQLRSFSRDCSWSDRRFFGNGSSVSRLRSLVAAIRNAQMCGLLVRSGNFLDLGLNFLGFGIGRVVVSVGVVRDPDLSFSSNRRMRSLKALNSSIVKCLMLSDSSLSFLERMY